MTSLKAIIFGPTGAVGHAAAIEAHRLGAKLTLGLRDPSKPIADLPDSIPRLQADLTNPSSVSRAVRESGATAAFLYTQDNMGPTFAALKEAGISYVVLLSSWTIYEFPGPLEHAIPKAHAIPQKHAEAELALQKSGLRYAAVRPLYFATNVLFDTDAVRNGEVDVLNPDGGWDYIASEDIGTVAGAVLVSGTETGPVDVIGAALVSQREAWRIIGKEIGKEIKVKEVDFEEFIKSKGGERNPFAKSLALGTVRSDQEKYPEEQRQKALENVRRFTGREPIRLEDWARKHAKQLL